MQKDVILSEPPGESKDLLRFRGFFDSLRSLRMTAFISAHCLSTR